MIFLSAIFSLIPNFTRKLYLPLITWMLYNQSFQDQRMTLYLFSYSETVSSVSKLDAVSSKCSRSEHCIVSLFSIQACFGIPLHIGDELLDCVKCAFRYQHGHKWP